MTAPAPVATAGQAVQLHLDEAIALCTAWLQHAVRERGIRLLILKGAALAQQGLREARTSADVDILVEPGRFEDAMALIIDAGWVEFTDSHATELLGTHSRTLRREGWPNSIDVHSHWPGLLRPADEVFDVLWRRRVQLNSANTLCDVPDRATNVLLLALHSLRSPSAQTRHREELEGILRLQLDEDDRDTISSLALATGCVAPLRDVLPQLGIKLIATGADLNSPAYLEWLRKSQEGRGGTRASSWLFELNRARWRGKGRVIRHGIWPTDRDLLAEHPEVEDRVGAKFRARIIRLARGVGQLPRVLPALRRR